MTGGGVTGKLSMPLTRGRIVGYDDERLAFGFTMLNDGETVDCQISDAAMDELAGVRGSPSTARQGQFLEYRDAIEEFASRPRNASYWKTVDAISALGAAPQEEDLVEAAVALCATVSAIVGTARDTPAPSGAR